ncbi:MAG: TPM domain-containing protein [Caloramator sp.]|nr:TPM domain-containing protein [Caloramator sp.]
MSSKSLVIVIILSILFIIISYTTSKEFSKMPLKDGYYVIDKADIISSSAQNRLEENLRLFKKNTGIDMYIVTVDSLFGYNEKEYGERLLQSFGNEGSVILLFSKNDCKSTIIGDYHKFIYNDYTLSYGFWVKNIGYENAVIKFYNNVIKELCKGLKVDNLYSIRLSKDIKENKEDYKLYGVTISTILMIISLAFFFNRDSILQRKNIEKNNYHIEKKEALRKLKNYLKKDLMILFVSIVFIVFYGLYLYDISKIFVFFVFIMIFSVALYPLFKDICSLIFDINEVQMIKVEGIVDEIFKTHFKYYFVIRDFQGNKMIITSHEKLVDLNNYISANCIKRTRYAVDIDILYNNIVLN